MFGRASNTSNSPAPTRLSAPSGSPRNAARSRARNSTTVASLRSIAPVSSRRAPIGASRRRRKPPSKEAIMSANPAPGWEKKPEHRVDLHPESRRVRVSFGDTTVADTTHALRVEETGHGPVMYIPAKDMRLDLMKKTDPSTYCPFTGTATSWTLNGGGKSSENAIWGYETPYDEMTGLAGYYAFYDT